MVPTRLHDSYSRALRANEMQARATLDEIVGRSGGVYGDQLAEVLAQAYPSLVRLYGDRSAALAVEHYMQVRDAEGVTSRYSPIMPEVDNGAQADVDRITSQLHGQRMVSAIATSLAKACHDSAARAIVKNAARDTARPRWAIVPHPGACAWCYMLASRGWEYASRKTALRQRHDNCTCTVEVEFDKKPELEGYDPDAIRDRMKGLVDSGSWDDILAEARRRNPDWLATGEGPEFARREGDVTSER